MPFSPGTKEKALARSGRRCCLCLSFKGVNVEVHHIVPEARSQDNTIENAIPLCFDCHSDAGHYNTKHPKGSKYTAGELRKHRDRLWKLVSEGKVLPEGNLDSIFISLMARAFDRPAFKTPFRQEGRMEDFDKAINDTVLAMNTGVLRTRDNHVVEDIGFGKSSLVDSGWRKTINEVERQLYGLKVSVAKALANGRLKSCHAYCYCGDPETIEELDFRRAEIIDTINSVLTSAGFAPIENILGMIARRKGGPTTRSTRTGSPRRAHRR